MKKVKSKQGKKVSKIMKEQNLLQEQIVVKNAEGDPDTAATIIHRAKISYTPKVSVIIPVYNVEEYLRECLDSVLNQTLKEIEVICVDDGSTDNSLNILKEYANKDNRITIISRENKGVGYSRNQGIECSKGDFLAFMDPDDYYPTLDVLTCLYNGTIKGKAKICGGSLIVFDENREQEIKRTDYYNYFTKDKLISYNDFQYDYGFQRYIYETKLIKDNYIYFPNYRRFQDPPFMVQAMIAAQNLYVLEKYVYAYRWAHKEVNWTEEKVEHLLLGLRDNLKSAQENNLSVLYDTTLNRIKKDYKPVIAKYQTSEIENIKKDVMEICISNAHNRYKKDKTNAKVSVILPIYNASQYLHECLDSVINQTLKEIEIICVNDGSTDNSLDIIKEYAAKDKRVKYIDKPNAGYGQTMNCGIDLASGEYIGIVEPDDFVKLEMYETLYNKAKKHNLDIVKSNIATFYNTKKHIDVPYLINLNRYDVVDKPYNFQKDMIHWHCTTTAIYHREFILSNNIRYNETPGAAYQDTSFWFKTHCLATSILFINKSFYMYRQGEEGQSTTNFRQAKAILYEYDSIYKFIINNKLYLFIPLWLYKKFKSCCWYYFSSPKELKKDLLLDIHNEFIVDVNRKYVDFSFFNNEQKLILDKFISSNFYNLFSKDFDNKIIISLTSYPARIGTVNQTIESLLNQSMKADKVILWLAPEQFPNKEQDLPQQLLALKDKGLTINWYHDIRSYKKLIPTLKLYPDAIIVTADDDIIYPSFWLRNLYNGYCNNKNVIWCHRAHKIQIKQNALDSYKNWQHCIKTSRPSYSNFCTSGGGVLYPPNCFYKDILNEDIFMNLCPTADDIWFWSMLVLNNKKINIIPNNMNYLNLIDGSQDTALWLLNNNLGQNDVQLNAIINHYPVLLKKILKENNLKYYKAYFLFLYYILALPRLRKRYSKKIINDIRQQLSLSRIDIKNFGNADNDIDVTSPTAKFSAPEWFKNNQGIGKVVSSSQIKNKLQIKAVKDGKLILAFKGADSRFNNVRFPVWIDYKSIKIDGKEILSMPISAWHDRPFHYEMMVKNGQVITVEYEQQPHIYSKQELNDIILKLNPKSEYIKNNIDKIVAKLLIKKSKPSKLFSIQKKDSRKIIRFLGIKLTLRNKRKELLNLLQQNRNELIARFDDLTSKHKQLEAKYNTQQQQHQKTIELLNNLQKQLIETRDNLEQNAKNNKAQIVSEIVNSSETIKQQINEIKSNTENSLNSLQSEFKQTAESNLELILNQFELHNKQNQLLLNNSSDTTKKIINSLYDKLSDFYVHKIEKGKDTLEFRTFANLSHCIRANLHKVPTDIDMVVGVPRSGIIPAYMIALFLNKKCCSLDDFLSNIEVSNGFRKTENKEIKNILIVDDSIFSGKEMTRTKEKLAHLNDKYVFKYMAVYARTESQNKVDCFFEIVDSRRVWQWNYLNHSIANIACFDMDGVLCVDPTPEENDDGEKYLNFILNAKPLYCPQYKIHSIVTSRLEKYRAPTEQWLKEHNIQYDNLVMLDLPTAEERRKLGCHAKFKADIYKNSDTKIFVESEPKQARDIALLTGKQVLCVGNDTLY